MNYSVIAGHFFFFSFLVVLQTVFATGSYQIVEPAEQNSLRDLWTIYFIPFTMAHYRLLSVEVCGLIRL